MNYKIFRSPAPMKVWRILVIAALPAVATIPVACSADHGPPEAPRPSGLGGAAPRAIHVFAKRPDGTSARLDFGQGTEVHFGGTASVGNTGVGPLLPVSGPGQIHTQDVQEGGTLLEAGATVESPGSNPWATAWALVWRAAVQCGSNYGQSLPPPWQPGPGQGGGLAPAPWYFYNTYQSITCLDRLSIEQNLVCVADKLAAVADAVGPQVWPALSPSDSGRVTYPTATDPGDLAYVEWDIPPQADADRFIVRDLAIHTLAMLPTLDAFTDNPFPSASMPTLLQPATCSQALAWVANPRNTPTGACIDDGIVETVFGHAVGGTAQGFIPKFPPSSVPLCDSNNNNNAPIIAQSALDIEAQILRSGGRLLHDLIRRDVYSDLAAAAQKGAQALDPVQGSQNAWGASAQSNDDLYGTISHAARTLLGRWEIGDVADFPVGVADPQCAGVQELELLPNAFGAIQLAARTSDRQIRTPGEQLAVQLVERTGLVVPTASLPLGETPATSTVADLRAALLAQLLLQTEAQDRLPEVSALDAGGPLGTALAASVARLADEDVLFAFVRALHTWQMLTDTSDPPAVGADAGGASPLVAGLTLAADPSGAPLVAPQVLNLGGVAVAGGLSRSRIVTDPMARASGMMEASQCADNTDYWDEWGDDALATLGSTAKAPAIVPPSAALPRETFQDAFHIGQAFERRLNVLQSAAAPLTYYPDPAAVARAGIAELRAWAGATIVHATPQVTGTGNTMNVSLLVHIGGMSAARDFGLAPSAPLDAVRNAFGFVYGPPWAAECAAGTRPDCPKGFAQSVQMATSATNVKASYANTGIVDDVFELTVPVSTGPLAAAVPAVNAPQTVADSHLYVVLLSDPASRLGQGRVLGTLPVVLRYGLGCGLCPPPIVGASVGFVDSPMQRELVHDAIDLGRWVGAKPPALGDPSAASTSGYCVDGVPRDLFVPLDNELVSGSATYEDSWQAYLSLAQQAAQTADTLGQQLIANDLQISQNQQAAEEQLANLCGDFGALSSAKVANDGVISSDPQDETTKSCLTEDTYDVVFLGSLPSTITATADPDYTTQIQAAINCGDAGAPATTPQSAVQLCKKSHLTAAALNIGAPADAGAPRPATDGGTDAAVVSDPACADLLANVAPSVRAGFRANEYLQDLQDPAQDADAMKALASQLKMSVDLSNHWQVFYGTEKIMDSTDLTYWPACLGFGCSSTNVTLARVTLEMAAGWSAAFRGCTNGTNPTTFLGTCDGGGIQAELNMLKWRVSNALWMIGAMAGEVPTGMFSLPLPAVFEDCTSFDCTDGHNDFPAGATKYYSGKLKGASGAACNGLASGCSVLDPTNTLTTTGDILTLGPAFAIDGSFSAFENGRNQEIPQWYLDTYFNTTNAFHAMMGANAPIIFDQCYGISDGETNPFAPGGSCPKSPTATAVQPADILSRGSGLEGLACAKNFGEAGAVAMDVGLQQPWWHTLASVKAGVNRGMSAGAGWNIGAGVPDEWGAVLSPATWPPMMRGLQYAGLENVEQGTCGALTLLLQASTLACTTTPQSSAISSVRLDQMPTVTHLTDVPALEAWLVLAQRGLVQAVGGFYAQNIPSRVVNDFKSGTVGSGSLGGTKGQAILTMEQQLQAFPSAWISIATDLGSIKSAIDVANVAIQAASLNEQTADGSLALSTIQTQGAMTQAVDNFMSTVATAAGNSVGSWGGSLTVIPTAALTMADSLSTGNQELTQLKNMANTAGQTEQNQVEQALGQLGTTTGPLWADIQKQIDNLRGAVAQIDATGQTIVQSQNQAAYQLAIGTGQDFVNIPGQGEVPIPVDTVLRRQASATLQRYEAALTQAKALAYMARRAIEQRIGMPLDTLTQQVGPLDAPASWADDICSLQGVNYASLSSALPATSADGGVVDGGGMGGAADQSAINQFANAWVGDYVAKLQNFVTYYNVQYPSHQGADTAVLSLRYDLLAPGGQCEVQAPNVLTNSGDLSAMSNGSWQLTPCQAGGTKCLAVVGGYALPAPPDGPWGSQGGHQDAGADAGAGTGAAPGEVGGLGVTWLLDVPNAGASVSVQDAGIVDASIDASLATASWPNNLVAQQVELAAGPYVLSWWDQARALDGSVLRAGGAKPPAYLVEVFDSSWITVAPFNKEPYQPAPNALSSAMWSERNALSFTVSQAGIYTIAFAASSLSEGMGSVAIADVQLEQAAGGQPSSYVATTDSTMVPGLSCPLSEADLRAAFTHSCDANGTCHYDLNLPFVVDTSSLDGTPISGKLATGNYNYRQVTSALNLVGTGVHSCANDPTQNCYGSGYVQYDLQHDATNAGVLGYDGNSRVFDFGRAGIKHGKALAAERYITMPLSSSDQQMISQPGIDHVELGGRPVDGTYHLRIWDSPDLNWGALQDVQVILNYEYWSQIQTQQSSQWKAAPRLGLIRRAPHPLRR